MTPFCFLRDLKVGDRVHVCDHKGGSIPAHVEGIRIKDGQPVVTLGTKDRVVQLTCSWVLEGVLDLVGEASCRSSGTELSQLHHIVHVLKNEINCRWEHGADGKEHLQYIEKQLDGVIRFIDGMEGK